MEEKARLLFQIPDSLDCGALDQNGVHQLAGMLCCNTDRPYILKFA